MKKLLLLSLLLMTMFAVACSTADTEEIPVWSGETSQPSGWGTANITITTGEEFAYIADAVNNGTTFKGTNITLENSIDLNNLEWPMIGGLANSDRATLTTNSYLTPTGNGFSGTFDGGGFTIENLKISQEDTVGVGLFGFICDGATIKNLRVEGVKVSAKGYAGAIVGKGFGKAPGTTLNTAPTKESIVTLIGLSVSPRGGDYVQAGSGLTLSGGNVSSRPTGGVAGSINYADMYYCYNDGVEVQGLACTQMVPEQISVYLDL